MNALTDHERARIADLLSVAQVCINELAHDADWTGRKMLADTLRGYASEAYDLCALVAPKAITHVRTGRLP